MCPRSVIIGAEIATNTILGFLINYNCSKIYPETLF